MRPQTVIAVTALTLGSLACGFVRGNGDEDDTEVGNDTEDTEADTVPVPEICQQYVDCVAATSPGSLGDIAETYAEGGSCWESESLAETCEDACVTAMEDLERQYPDEEDCVANPTEDDGCPYEGDDWIWVFDIRSDDCGLSQFEGDEMPHTLDCADQDDGPFTIEGDFWTGLECESTGDREFECIVNTSTEDIAVVGRFVVAGTYAEGTMEYVNSQYGCSSEGTFELYPQ